MLLIPTRKCAVHGTLEAKRIRIRMFEVDDDGGAEVTGSSEVLRVWEEDLSVRALRDLEAKIGRAIKLPVTRKPKEGTGDGK